MSAHARSTHTSGAPALELRRLTVSYGSRPAVWDIDASVPRGSLAAIVGPNGAGKSTVLKGALGLIPADHGQTLVDGHPLTEVADRVAYVPQRDEVDWDFPITVREVAEMGRYRSAGWLRRLSADDRDQAVEALDRVGMASLADRQIGQLSGGQRQRAFLARALAQRAPLLLMDEPFAGVDARTEAAILDLLRELVDEGRTVVCVHHALATVRQRFDWALLMNVRAVATGPVAQALHPDAIRRAYAADPDDVEELAWAT